MKRKKASANPIADAASRNPSTVLAAFAPETEFVLTLDDWILLEAMDSPFATGGRPGLQDIVIAALVMADSGAVRAARRAGKWDAMLARATAGRRPAEILPLGEKVGAAIRAAFDPIDSGVDSTGEKKSSTAADGGSP